MPEIISRKDAIAAGLSRYFTGEPCKHGHMAERRLSGHCIPCRDAAAREKHSGMPPETYHQLLIEQAGLCAICEQPMMGEGSQGANADHCYMQPGVFRGLLCNGCNIALGFVEKPGWLHRALAYVEEHKWDAR
jgi:hypothetical protein